MINVVEGKMKFRDKKILVVGLARSGSGAANLLSAAGACVTVTDKRSRESLQEYIEKLSSDVKIVTGGNPEEIFNEADTILVSPGVPLDIPPLAYAKSKGVPVIGELELAYQSVRSNEFRIMSSKVSLDGSLTGTHYSLPAFIGITGTNGKSTVTTLIDLMLKGAGKITLLGGNIGNALTEEIMKIWARGEGPEAINENNPVLFPEYIVAEISSFQLETIKEFRPKVAAILNITPDHLDRYEGMQGYIDAKARIFENQSGDDYLVLNADDPLIMELYDVKKAVMPKVFFFSRKKVVEGVYLKGNTIFINLPDDGSKGVLQYAPTETALIDIEEIKIKGVHNIENAMAASLLALLSGCTDKAVKDVLKSFAGLEHRLEFVEEINGVSFINDSKGTNAGAVSKSLEGLENVVLIMGGLDKGSDFSVLRDLIERKVKLLVLLGEAKEKIERAAGGTVRTVKVNSLREAVEVSMANASRGDVVLLSPGCASFDMFSDFEDRGRKFKEAVRGLIR
jgi:UDP-N-acetylmuramoylalanine--D-glutamate ligase